MAHVRTEIASGHGFDRRSGDVARAAKRGAPRNRIAAPPDRSPSAPSQAPAHECGRHVGDGPHGR